MDIIKYKNIFFLISGILLIPGLISLALWGLKPAIDFTGGSRLIVQRTEGRELDSSKIEEIVSGKNTQVFSVRFDDVDTAVIRTNPIDQRQKNELVQALQKEYKVRERSFETVGPTIGDETTGNAVKAVLIASTAILAYIAYSFRHVSRPVASWKFGIAAIAALIHDVLIVVGLFAILGHFLHVEVDALFITALLTVMGFSVHDTIVVFDRIRENLRKNENAKFDNVVNTSILETFNRSLNTSLTVLIVLFALLLFGGESIRWFIVALLVGVAVGTYSSIFNASPLLVVWHEWDKRRLKSKK